MATQKRAVKVSKSGKECFEVKGYTRNGKTVQGYKRCLNAGERKKEARIETGKNPKLGSSFDTTRHNARVTKAQAKSRETAVFKAIEEFKASMRLRKTATGKEILALIRKLK